MAIKTAARIARFSMLMLVRPGQAAAGQRRRGEMGDSAAADRRPAPVPAPDRDRARPGARTPNNSARSDTAGPDTGRAAVDTRSRVAPLPRLPASRACPRSWYRAQRLTELVRQPREGFVQCRPLCDDDHRTTVRCRLAGSPEGLSHTAPSPVAANSAPNLAGDGKASPSRRARLTPQHEQRRPLNALALLEERLDFGAAGQPLGAGEPPC